MTRVKGRESQRRANPFRPMHLRFAGQSGVATKKQLAKTIELLCHSHHSHHLPNPSADPQPRRRQPPPHPPVHETPHLNPDHPSCLPPKRLRSHPHIYKALQNPMSQADTGSAPLTTDTDGTRSVPPTTLAPDESADTGRSSRRPSIWDSFVSTVRSWWKVSRFHSYEPWSIRTYSGVKHCTEGTIWRSGAEPARVGLPYTNSDVCLSGALQSLARQFTEAHTYEHDWNVSTSDPVLALIVRQEKSRRTQRSARGRLRP